MGSIMEIDCLSKRFGDVQAVQELSFQVKEEELFAFPGVNGALRQNENLTVAIVLAAGLYVGMNILSGRTRHRVNGR